MKKYSIILLSLFCVIKISAQNESDFEKFVREICVRTYDTITYDERTGHVIRTIIPPRLFLYEYEQDSIKRFLSNKNNDNVFYENIMSKYDTTGNKDLQNLFFRYYVQNCYDKKMQGQDISLYLNKFLHILSNTSAYYLDNIIYLQEECLINIDNTYYTKDQLKIISEIINNFEPVHMDTLYDTQDLLVKEYFKDLSMYYINTCLIAGRLYMNAEIKNINKIKTTLKKYNSVKLNKMNLSLARLGDKESIDYYVSILKKKDCRATYLAEKISFILQKDLIDFLVKELYSEDYSSLMEEYYGEKDYYKHEALTVLEPIVDFDFSGKEYEELNSKLKVHYPLYLDDEVERMRLFFRLNKDYKIVKNPPIYYNLMHW
jgi:hypothetical protein